MGGNWIGPALSLLSALLQGYGGGGVGQDRLTQLPRSLTDGGRSCECL
jgi:hypothetical protein